MIHKYLIKNKKFMLDNSYLLHKKEDYCVRCKTRPVLFICSNCADLNNFCEQCDYYVHSINSKKSHRRSHISNISNEQLLNENSYSGQNFYANNRNNSYNLDHTKSLVLNNTNSFKQNENNNYSINNNSRVSTNPHTLYDLTNKSINKFTLIPSEKPTSRSTSNVKLYEK